MKIGVIILCRSSSRRLPNKIFSSINGIPALKHTYNQLTKVFDEADIVIATSSHESDNQIQEFCRLNNWNCFRGSLSNVAERFLLCAETFQFDFAIRINGDNIFVNRELLNDMAGDALSEKYDFLSNVDNRTYPRGLSIEIIRTTFFRAHISEINLSQEFKEHVLLYFYQCDSAKTKHYYNKQSLGNSDISFALDTKEDLARIKKIIKGLGKSYPNYTYNELMETYEQLGR